MDADQKLNCDIALKVMEFEPHEDGVEGHFWAKVTSGKDPATITGKVPVTIFSGERWAWAGGVVVFQPAQNHGDVFGPGGVVPATIKQLKYNAPQNSPRVRPRLDCKIFEDEARAEFFNHQGNSCGHFWGKNIETAVCLASLAALGRVSQPTDQNSSERDELTRCDYCGALNEARFLMTCPGCQRPGCPDCMPAGRSTLCPQCEGSDQV